MKGQRATLLAAAVAILLLFPASATAAISVSRAELSGTQLRVEGAGAVRDATITVDGIAMGQADRDGDFSISRSGFSSSTCLITVSDGSTSTQAQLSGCTPSGPAKPTFFLRTENAMVGKQTRWQASGSNSSSDSLAFVFDWGDGTTTRDPTTGFYTVDPITRVVDSAEVRHVFSTAGDFSVRITALDAAGRSATSDPAVVHVAADTQTDCGQAGDADDSVEQGRSIGPVPVQCTGTLQGQNGIDSVDVYTFQVGQEFRLLTLSGTSGRLYSPAGVRDHLGRLVPEPVPSFYGQNGFAWTLEEAGTWKLEIAGFSDRTYTFNLQTDLAGDDCVSGRNPDFAIPPPFDAPNNEFSLVIGNFGEVDCTGSLPAAALDRFDSYVFRGDAAVSELVAVSVTPAVEDYFCGRRFRLFFGPPELSPKAYACLHEVFSIGAGAVASPGLESFAGESSYRLRLATSSRRNGDCFSGGRDAGASPATAVPLHFACLGDLSATDSEDWLQVAATAGDELHLTKIGPVPLEVWDPTGTKRADNSGGVLIDRTGDWHVRTLTDKPGFAHFEGVYGLEYFFRKGFATRDCGTGADTPLVGLQVTLPVSCGGDFLPFATDTSDRYAFQLAAGDVLQVTVSAHDTFDSQWTASIDTPSTPRVLTQMFRNTAVTFTYTATETGTHTLFLERTPATGPFDLRYSVSISKQAAPPPPPPPPPSEFRGATANAPASGGDGNGYETSPANAHADDGAFAVDTNSGTDSDTSCSDRDKDKHVYRDYGFSLPSDATIEGIEVRVDAKVDSTSGSPRICVQLSWDGGSSWTSPRATATLGTTEGTHVLGGPTTTWGRTWSPSNFTNANFRVRVIDVASSTARDFSLDWIAVRVHH